MKFDGSRQANSYAEAESRKQKCDLYVIKSLAGALHYEVVNTIDNLAKNKKVIGHYKAGDRI